MSKNSKSSTPDSGGATALGGAPASGLGRFSWAMFDWANQPYFTVVTTVIFAPYFVQTYVGDPVKGQELYSFAIGIAGLLIAFLSPIFGSIADAAGRRKPWMAAFSLVFVLSSLLLWQAVPGAGAEGGGVVVLGLILAAISMEMAVVFNHSMLPGIVREERMGWLSGFAWGLGYFGGIVALLGLSWLLIYPGVVDLPGIADTPLFGVDQAAGVPERLTGPLSALWYLLFVWPLFVFTPDGTRSGLSPGKAVMQGLKSLGQTFAHAKRYGNVLRFLLARMIYNDGLGAIFAFGGIYASVVFGWGSVELGISGLIMLVFSGFGAIFGGWLDDRLGSKATILIALGLLLLGSLGIASVNPEHIFIFFHVDTSGVSEGLFATLPEQIYLCFGVVLGLGMGPAQSASRTMMARLAPEGMITEFFGLFALSGKATAFLAPLLIGVATGLTQDARVSILVIIAMLSVGAVLLMPVREERAG